MKPKCGRMVGFSSGGENPHGVKAVTSGQRCAVALWFTLDPLFRELVKTNLIDDDKKSFVNVSCFGLDSRIKHLSNQIRNLLPGFKTRARLKSLSAPDHLYVAVIGAGAPQVCVLIIASFATLPGETAGG